MNEEAGRELLSEIEIIEAQPLGERAKSFEMIYEKLLADLKRSDHAGETDELN